MIRDRAGGGIYLRSGQELGTDEFGCFQFVLGNAAGLFARNRYGIAAFILS